MAYVTPYELTAIDIAAMRKADYIVLWYGTDGVGPHGLVHAVKRAPDKSASEPFPRDATHMLEAPIRTTYDYRDPEGSWRCVTSISLYHSQHCHASSVFRTLKVGDAIAFEFYPDGHSTDSMKEAGFHTDLLRLHVYRKGATVAVWDLKTETTNSQYRMCRPKTPQYRLVTSGEA